MTVRILRGDVRAVLRTLEPDSIDCVVTSPPYWGLRDYGVAGQIGMEPTLGEHLAVLVDVFREVRRVMKPEASLWLNYGDCYATTPNGRSAAATKVAGNDDRTFRDKPFSTVGPVHPPESGQPFPPGLPRRGGGNAPAGPVLEEQPEARQAGRRGRSGNLTNGGINGAALPSHRVVAGGFLKPKDLCMVANRLAIALQDDGWWVRAENIWGKPNPMPDSSGRYRPSTAHEKVWLFTKGPTAFYDSEAVRMPPEESTVQRLSQNVEAQTGSTRANAGGKTNGNMKAVGRIDKQRGHSRRHAGFNERWDAMTVQEQRANGRLFRNYEQEPWKHINFAGEVWDISPVGFTEAHFATFPPALVEPCIASSCPPGGLVLDPFGGAGTTGLVADRMGRDAVLIELNPDFADMAARRIADDAGLFSPVVAA